MHHVGKEFKIIPGDLHELLMGVLLVDGGHLGVGGGHQDGGELLDDRLELSQTVLCVVLEGRVPHLAQLALSVQGPHGQRQGGGGQDAGGDGAHGVGAEGQLHDVPGEYEELSVRQ